MKSFIIGPRVERKRMITWDTSRSLKHWLSILDHTRNRNTRPYEPRKTTHTRIIRSSITRKETQKITRNSPEIYNRILTIDVWFDSELAKACLVAARKINHQSTQSLSFKAEELPAPDPKTWSNNHVILIDSVLRLHDPARRDLTTPWPW